MARVAFIGLGNMGGGMAANLAGAGHDVHAFDLSDEALDRAKQAGCLPVADVAAALLELSLAGRATLLAGGLAST